LIAGGSARGLSMGGGAFDMVSKRIATAVAATALAPAELLKTRLFSTNGKGTRGHLRAAIAGVRKLVKANGATVLWRGISPTLWRDVPFSGMPSVKTGKYKCRRDRDILFGLRVHPQESAPDQWCAPTLRFRRLCERFFGRVCLGCFCCSNHNAFRRRQNQAADQQ